MGKPAARIGDMHVCPMVTPGVPPVPHVGGPIVGPGAPTVMIGGVPAAVMGDMCTCVGPPDSIILGSLGVMIGGKPAARMGDSTAHGGSIVLGLPTVMIGDIGNAGVVMGITITGTPEFIQAVAADIVAISQTPTGAALLQAIEQSDKKITIVETAGGNACGYTNGDDRFLNADGTNGAGTDANVKYNPNRGSIGTEPWETRPPAIGLAHELVHAQQAQNGSMKEGEDDNDGKADPTDPTKKEQENKRELEAAGIEPYHDTNPYSENKIRSEWDPPQPQRQWY